jgi:hypothetical protein
MRAAALAAAAAAVVAAAVVGATPAAAGTFRVSQCAAWDGSSWAPRTLQSSAWSATGGYLSSSCGTAGGHITLTPPNLRLAQSTAAIARVAVPAALPHASIRSAWLDWTALAQAPSVDPAYASVSGGGAFLVDEPVGWSTHPRAADRLVAPSGTRSLTFGLWCSPVNGPGFCNWPAAPLAIRGLTLELEESVPPAVSGGGGLLDGAPRGRTTLTLHAADADSGVRTIAATLAGMRLATVDLGGACGDDRFAPCPTDVRRTVEVDTARIPPGTARLRLRATDLAGNVSDVDAGAVTIAPAPHMPPPAEPPPVEPPGGAPDEAPPPVPPAGDGPAAFPPNPLAGRGHVANGRGPVADARVSARLRAGGLRGVRLTVGARRHVRVLGHLVAPDGTPVGGAVLTVVERRAGRRWRVAGVARTRGDGRFSAPLAAGPSRRVAVVFHPFGDTRRGRWSRRLGLRVRARVAVALVLRGARVRLEGRVTTPVPRGGVLVGVDRRAGGRWRVAATLRTDTGGRFSWRPARGTARLRVRVPSQAGYGYAAGRSRAVALRSLAQWSAMGTKVRR